MQAPTRPLVLALLVVTAGCLAVVPGASPGNSQTTGTPTPEPVNTLPGPDCLTDAAPAHDTDRPVTRPYPEPPSAVNRTSLGRYVAALERTYVHNYVAEQSSDVERVETTIDDSPPIQRDGGDGYVVTLQYHLATYFGAETHGDAWPEVTYRVNSTAIQRHQDGDHPGPEGTVTLLRC